MKNEFEFQLVFALPQESLDPVELSNAVFEAGLEDALVGTGIPGLLAVEVAARGNDAQDAILDCARLLMEHLPEGTCLREIRPDLVSLADVAEKLGIKRQALQQRQMPPPSLGGLYRIDEVAETLLKTAEPEKGRRKPRFDVGRASPWLSAGAAARKLNAMLTTRQLDPHSLELKA